MKYRYILTYQATDSETTYTRTCFPLHGDDLAISIDRAEGEWYYTRNLDGKLVFTGGDYDWIMAREFDGTFTLDIKESHDNGATFYDYFTGTFSLASLEIDKDNHTATLNGLKEGVEDLIKNGAKEDYDLMKLIPDTEVKEVQGGIWPALALVDEHSSQQKVSFSDIYCNGAITSGGYNEKTNNFWASDKNMYQNPYGWLVGIQAEAKLVKKDGRFGEVPEFYAGTVGYVTISQHGSATMPDVDFLKTSIDGTLIGSDGLNSIRLSLYVYTVNGVAPGSLPDIYISIQFPTGEVRRVLIGKMYRENTYYSPLSLSWKGDSYSHFESLQINFHYIYASLLTVSDEGEDVNGNILVTGPYYKGIRRFIGGGLEITSSSNTSEQSNGHRLIAGTDLYFAPPEGEGWIPLAEDNWNYASMWYRITPSVANGLQDRTLMGTWRWTRCWTIGCCIKHLLQRITNDKVVFSESTDYSQFLYGNPNPVEGHEPFQWLVTQKSNVMHPAAGSASRCIVRLDWFLELLRNAFNCYYWFERRNDGRYDFRIEHVEYFRRGGAYNGDLADQLDLTRLKPVRNFLRNGQPAKHYADQTNKYTFDLDNMVEKYTYSWQGDGGGDDFKGNPMYFRAGWIEKGSSDDRQVDNIFADLGWLMLNAGTETASSKNYDGLFIFGGYRPMMPDAWNENTAPLDEWMVFTTDNRPVRCDLYITAPEGQQMGINTGSYTFTVTGTGTMQHISMTGVGFHFGTNYTDVVIHRIHAHSGNVFRVPNVRNLLRTNTINYLQNGVLAWPWLQCEYLHYDIPAAKWTYLKDEYTDNPDLMWEADGTIKMVKKQTLAVVPVPDAYTEDAIVDIMGVKTGLGIGIIDNAKINLSSRNAEMTIIYDINPQNQ